MTTNLPAIKQENSLLEGYLEQNGVAALAQLMAPTDFCPAAFKNKPEALTIAMMYADQLGLPILTGIQNIFVVKGRPQLWGDAIVAVARRHPKWDESKFTTEIDGEGQHMVATATAGRTDGNTHTATFSWEDAKNAGLLGRDTYKHFQQDMLMAKASSRAIRRAFGDAMLGIEFEGDPGVVAPESAAEAPQALLPQPDAPQVVDITSTAEEVSDDELEAAMGKTKPAPEKQKKPRREKTDEEVRRTEPVREKKEPEPEPETEDIIQIPFPTWPDVTGPYDGATSDGRTRIGKMANHYAELNDNAAIELVEAFARAGADGMKAVTSLFAWFNKLLELFDAKTVDEVKTKDPLYWDDLMDKLEAMAKLREAQFKDSKPAPDEDDEEDNLPF